MNGQELRVVVPSDAPIKEASQERTLSALPIRIEYQYPRRPYACEARGDDFLLRPIRHTGELGIGNEPDFGAGLDAFCARAKWLRENGCPEPAQLDAYALREAFDDVKAPLEALSFLANSGRFWPWEAILWSQFQEWQKFFRWLRMDHDKAIMEPEGKKAWDTAQGGTNTFFATTPGGPRTRENYITHAEQRLIYLYRFAIYPERDAASAMSILWRKPGDKSFAGAPPALSFRGQEQQPYLQIEAHETVEAIAATIWADRCSGVRYRRCKECARLFRVESDHGQEFCPPPPPPSVVKTSRCKNKWTSRDNRKNKKNGKSGDRKSTSAST